MIYPDQIPHRFTVEQTNRSTTPGRRAFHSLLSLENGATIHTGNLTFAWTAVPGAAHYHLQAAGGTAFDQQYNIIEYWGLTEPTYTFNVTSGFVIYFPRLYWRVQAIDANHVQGPWSEVRVIYLVSL